MLAADYFLNVPAPRPSLPRGAGQREFWKG